ncbi:psmD3 [Symbiodinium sp. KB8]|nr:psmD3 [Symbiodinium sp. KB8]
MTKPSEAPKGTGSASGSGPESTQSKAIRQLSPLAGLWSPRPSLRVRCVLTLRAFHATVLYRNISTLDKAATARDRRMVLRVLRQTAYVRQHVSVGELVEASRCVTDAVVAPLVAAVLEALPLSGPMSETKVDEEGDVSLSAAGVSASSAAPAGDSGAPCETHGQLVKVGKLPEVSTAGQASVGSYFLYLGVARLVHAGLWQSAFEHAAEAVQWLEGASSETSDNISARLYSLLCLAGERQGLSSQLSGFLLRQYRTACLRHNDIVQATLLNLLLRGHMANGAYDAAEKLLRLTEFPESVSNNQFVRHLYYSARIAALQTDYATAHQRVTQAQRKAPSGTAEGFRMAVAKLAVVVQLLLGEVPAKSTFHMPHAGGEGDAVTVALAPYLAISQAVRVGNTAAFEQAVSDHLPAFVADGNLSLVRRLTHTVLKAGLKKISRSYSRIAFEDIAAKLGVPSAVHAEALVAKAVRDVVIQGTLDSEAGTFTSQDTEDVYATTAPAEAFHQRIQFLLDVKTDAVQSMQYPPDAYRKEVDKASKAAAEAEAEEEEIADVLEQGGDLDDEGDESE